MNKPRLLITGGSGFLGGRLIRDAAPYFKTVATYYHTPIRQDDKIESFRLDITDREAVGVLITRIRPAVVIHAAALASLNESEENRTEAWNANVMGTDHVASACKEIGARLIFISTDLVHDGEAPPYSESDTGNPICYYGETKKEGEFVALRYCDNACVARVALIYGKGVNGSKCFTESIIRDLHAGRPTKLFTDEYRTPVYLNDLTRALIDLIRISDVRGRINIAGPDRLSRYEHGLKIADVFGFRRELIVPASRNEVRYGERRPKDCSLTTDLLTRRNGFVFSGVEESLRHMREEFFSSIA